VFTRRDFLSTLSLHTFAVVMIVIGAWLTLTQLVVTTSQSLLIGACVISIIAGVVASVFAADAWLHDKPIPSTGVWDQPTMWAQLVAISVATAAAGGPSGVMWAG
jgi:hypothetical protein